MGIFFIFVVSKYTKMKAKLVITFNENEFERQTKFSSVNDLNFSKFNDFAIDFDVAKYVNINDEVDFSLLKSEDEDYQNLCSDIVYDMSLKITEKSWYKDKLVLFAKIE